MGNLFANEMVQTLLRNHWIWVFRVFYSNWSLKFQKYQRLHQFSRSTMDDVDKIRHIKVLLVGEKDAHIEIQGAEVLKLSWVAPSVLLI